MTTISDLLTEAASRTSPWKLECRLCSTTNLTPVGEQDVGGLGAEENDRALLVGQTDKKLNGPWVVRRDSWLRPVDYNDSQSARIGTTIIVPEGANAGVYRLTAPTAGEVVPDQTETTWTLIAAYDSASTTAPDAITDLTGHLGFNGSGNLDLTGTQAANLEAANMALRATTTSLHLQAAGGLTQRGQGVSIRANGDPDAPGAGQVIIRGSTIELTGTLTNNGSPIGGGGGGGASISDSGASVDTTGGDVSATSSAGDSLVMDGEIVATSADGAAVVVSDHIALVYGSGAIYIGQDATGSEVADSVTCRAATTILERVGSATRTTTASTTARTDTYNGALAILTGAAATVNGEKLDGVDVRSSNDGTGSLSFGAPLYDLGTSATARTLPSISAGDVGKCIIVRIPLGGGSSVLVDGDGSDTINGAVDYTLDDTDYPEAVFIATSTTTWAAFPQQ